MLHIAYVNGRYLPHEQASVHIEDRGYQLADGVYEVCIVRDGHLIDEERHIRRLARSLDELQIRWPMHRSALAIVMREVVRRNRIRDGTVYVQVTRGVAPRNHPFPPASVPPSLVVTARTADIAAGEKSASEGIAVITTPDTRWERVDIKSVSLLPNVLAKQKAREAGAQEAWFVDTEGNVKEGASTNAWIVTPDGVMVTRPADRGILRGITRTTLFDVAEKLGLSIEERGFSVSEAKRAREAFITSATSVVMPVVAIDGEPVANGHPGSIALSLRQAFFDVAEKRLA